MRILVFLDCSLGSFSNCYAFNASSGSSSFFECVKAFRVLTNDVFDMVYLEWMADGNHLKNKIISNN